LVEELYPNIYVNRIPLPNFPVKATNSYIIKSGQRNLIIDTGIGTEIGREAMMQGIRELKVDLSKTDLILTHLHPDHTGIASFLQDQGAAIYIGKTDGQLIKQMYSKTSKTALEQLYEVLLDEIDVMPIRKNEFGYDLTETVQFDFLTEKDSISIGDYTFEVVDIPGHTPGHIGLLERKHRLFFGGDHILNKITPSVMFWGFEQDILGLYISSLRKVYDYNLDYLFPAHDTLIRDYKTRIDELISHVEERLDEVKKIISQKKKAPLEITSQVQWNVPCRWEDFPRTLKLLALGETVSHLEHLVYRGVAERHYDQGIVYYQLSGFGNENKEE